MLDGLDAIPWANLQHAFGSASGVPALLRCLESRDAPARSNALTELCNNILHQGTVYEATPHALPFLIRLLQQEGFPERASVAWLVASIIAGRGYYEAHSSLVADARPDEFADEIDRERAIVADIHRIGIDAVPALLPFLADPEREIRASVAEALACYPSRAPDHVPVMQSALSVEKDEETRERIQESLDRIRSQRPA